MEPTKITPKKLQEIMDLLGKGSEDSRGTYLYKDFRLQISKYKASGAERTSRLYHKRREQGLCIRCGEKVKDKNPRSGKLYRLCADHRDIIDHKDDNGNSGKPAAKAVKKSAAKSDGKADKSSAKTTTKKATKKAVAKAKKK